jgi:hypothetical protein
MWGVDQDQLNPYVAYEGYVVRVPHNPLVNQIYGDKFLNPLAVGI